MKPPLENIRVSQRSRDILITLKRKTGIANWNVLCRWAFCDSLANPNRPAPPGRPTVRGLEIPWATFAGTLSNALLAVFYRRAGQDGVGRADEAIAAYFRSHLERGIQQLGSRPQRLLESLVVQRRPDGYGPTRWRSATGSLIGDHEQRV